MRTHSPRCLLRDVEDAGDAAFGVKDRVEAVGKDDLLGRAGPVEHQPLVLHLDGPVAREHPGE
ncbi:hypothetical protein CLBKND_04810 [Methylorubrum aminovorans]